MHDEEKYTHRKHKHDGGMYPHGKYLQDEGMYQEMYTSGRTYIVRGYTVHQWKTSA
jgi:hypothetical protein